MNSKENSAEAQKEVAARRREFLVRVLRKAAYTAPLILAMSMHRVASAAQSAIEPH